MNILLLKNSLNFSHDFKTKNKSQLIGTTVISSELFERNSLILGGIQFDDRGDDNADVRLGAGVS
jgi:hypothetical protein